MRNTPNGRRKHASRIFLVVVNVLLIVIAVVSTLANSNNIKNEQTQMEIDSFCSAIESMKRISENYLETERGYVRDWGRYIEQEQMSMDEALQYIRTTNSQKDRYAHIVDMDTFHAYSTYEKNGSNEVSCYRQFKEQWNPTDQIFINNMRHMFTGDDDVMTVLGKYRIKEMQIIAVSVGTKVTLRIGDGSKKDYLLLRVIPVESIKKIWVFPTEYLAAEVGMITQSGDYVVQSASMKSISFPEFIRAYNFEDDYNREDDLITQLESTDRGLLRYKNSKGKDSYWYYSAFDQDSGVDIIGYIQVDDLRQHATNWQNVIIICCIFFILVLIDGLHLWRINRRLREAVADAVQANKAKTRFLSSMSHDIRTPMNAVIGMTNLAKKHLDDPAYVADCLEKVSLSSDHLLTLINDILDISKVESGNMALNPAVVSLDQQISNLVNIIRPQAENRGLEFQVTERDIICHYVMADALRVNQILINLLTNAVKYTNPGGVVRLEVFEKGLSDTGDHVRLVFVVADTGIGMSRDFQRTMYESFSREKDSRIDKTQGSGLGLAIAKQMTDLMNGTIVCDSRQGKGTTFMVTLDLPIAQGVSDAAEHAAEGSHLLAETGQDEIDVSGIHLLIAEDNELNWEIIAAFMNEYGVTCDRAADGQQCVDCLLRAPEGTYDLVLMDIQMPVMNGREATRVIRKSSLGHVRDIPIYAMTADAFAEDQQACFEAGMNGHISKPIDMDKVLAILRTVKLQKQDK